MDYKRHQRFFLASLTWRLCWFKWFSVLSVLYNRQWCYCGVIMQHSFHISPVFWYLLAH